MINLYNFNKIYIPTEISAAFNGSNKRTVPFTKLSNIDTFRYWQRHLLVRKPTNSSVDAENIIEVIKAVVLRQTRYSYRKNIELKK